ncbi:cell division protein ZipA [Thalassotalea ponticola]|uniref:cell division protein ZipA n=1 Tax=Thalassotalea ponticola TaxID=1523392 RepID=UPI0025B2C316|nr:cell division protein ZipA [Thalassotalea ponticola]MDN3652182.1 cell division protein ZipA [Thalassotalea ponticola]
MELSFRDILIIISVVVIIAIYVNGRRKIHKGGKNPIKLKSAKVEEPDPNLPEREFGDDGLDQFGVGIPKPIHLDQPVSKASEETLQAMRGQTPPMTSEDDLYAQAPSLDDVNELVQQQDSRVAAAHSATVTAKPSGKDSLSPSDEQVVAQKESVEELITEDLDTEDLFAQFNDFEQNPPVMKQSTNQRSDNRYTAFEQQTSFDDQLLVADRDIEHTVSEHAISEQKVQPSVSSASAGQHDVDDLETIKPTISAHEAKYSSATDVKVTTPSKREQIDFDFEQQEQTKQPPLEQEVLALSVEMPQNREISGAELLPCFLTLGLKYGEMNIFHRHQDNAGNGQVTFSVANMVNPGTFDLDNMEQFSTRGITMFMTLPNAADPQTVFSQMLNAAKQIAAEFGGRVLDGQRSVMTRQTEQHYISKIREFDRKARLAGY